MTIKKTAADGKIENTTKTELEILQNIEKSFYNQNTGAMRRNTEKSLKWFSQYVPRSFNNVRTARVFRDRSLWEDKIRVGHMYTYSYDALHKDKLPVWDAQPLVFFFDNFKSKEGKELLLGINLHYLKPQHRFIAFKALLKLRNQKRYNASTKLKMSWSVLSGLANSKFFEHSVKMYRVDHVRSKFVKIPPSSWELVLFLPIARWQTGSKKEAWKMKNK